MSRYVHKHESKIMDNLERLIAQWVKAHSPLSSKERDIARLLRFYFRSQDWCCGEFGYLHDSTKVVQGWLEDDILAARSMAGQWHRFGESWRDLCYAVKRATWPAWRHLRIRALCKWLAKERDKEEPA